MMRSNPFLTQRQLGQSLVALACLFSVNLRAVDIDTTGGATITGPINFGANDTVSNITGAGTLTLNGSGLIGLANNGGGRTVNMNMTGGLIDIGSGVRLQNGGWSSGNWTNNLASVNIAAGGTLDVWDGSEVRLDALAGAGLVDITRGIGIENFGAGWAGTRSIIVGVNNGGGTFTGVIAGSTALGDGGNLNFTKNGTGTQILTGTNTYAGTTTISGGTLQIGNGGSTGTIGTGNITNNAALVFNRSGTSTVAGSISGSGSLTTSGTGTFILASNNSYSGATTINTGSTLQIGNGGGTGSLGTASPVTNSGTLAYNLNGYRTLDKVISGSGSVSYAGGGVFEPTVDHSYTGTTTITSSQVIASGDGRLGTAPATPTVSIIMDGGSIFNGNFATTLHANRTIQLNAGGGQFRAGYGQNFTVNGKLTGAGSLSLNWDGAPLILANAANDYAGDTVIGIVGAGAYTPGGAQLRMGVTNALPYGAGKGNLVLNTNADTPGATSNLDLNGFNTQVNGLNGTSAGRIYSSNAATLTVGNNDQNGSFAGLIQSNASLAKAGSGTQILSGGNSYSGTTTISAGTLQIGDGGTTGALGAGNVTNDATLTFNRSNDYAVGNGMTGSGNVIKNGAGTVTFTNAKNYNGTTTVNAGVLELNAGGPGGTLAGSGPIVINNGGTLRANQTDALGYNNYSATNGITINEGGTLTTHNGHRYSNDRSITSIGGTITSSGTGFNSGASYTMRSWNGASYNFTSASSGTPSTISATDFGLQGDVNFNVTDGPGAVDLNVTGNIVNVFGQGNLIKSGAGVMVLAADNTYTGPTTINAGTLQVGAGGSAGSLGAGATTNNASLVFNRSDASAYTGAISGSGSVTKAGAGTHTLSGELTYNGGTTVNGGRLVLENSITGSSNHTTNAELEFNVTSGTRQLQGGTISGTGNLIKTGSSVLQLGGNGQPQTIALTGANSLIDVQGGVLRNEYGNSAWGGNKAGVNVASGAVFDIWDGNTTIDELTGSGTVNKGWSNSNTLTIGIDNGSGTFTGVIENNRTDLGNGGNGGGTLSLVKNGTGTQVLSGNNTYAGSTTINAGIIEALSNNALGSTADGTTVASGTALRLNNVNYSSAEPLSINGSGISNGGALQNVGTSIYAGTITAATNATINAGGGTLTTTGGLVKNGTTLTIAGGGKVIVNGTGISGSAASSDLIVDATTLVVNANSNYNGPTTVQNGGTLVANATVQSTTVTIDAGNTLSGTGRVEAATNSFIYINGTLQVGDSTLGAPVASQLELATSGTGSTVTGLSSTLSFDLFSNAGNNTGIVSSSDRIRLFGSLDSFLGGTLFLNNPMGLSGFAVADSWKLFDLSGGGSISTDFALNYSSLSLSPGLSGSFDRTSGIFSILGVPEPSRALLLMLGLTGLFTRRRR